MGVAASVHQDRAPALILKQYCLGCLAHASGLITDEASGEAAVVEPQPASLLQREGVPGAADLVGGMAAWEAARLPVVAA